MTAEEYCRRMKVHEETFDKLWMEIVKDTNSFLANDPKMAGNFSSNSIDKFTDQICLSGAWIQDRLNGYKFGHRRGLTKKIRRVLGYTYP
jgi:hypothetical protein